jgi:hypothetical protein
MSLKVQIEQRARRHHIRKCIRRSKDPGHLTRFTSIEEEPLVNQIEGYCSFFARIQIASRQASIA